MVLGLLGCQQRPAVPTLAIQPTEPVVVVVVTATSQPTLAPTKTAEMTITPMPTLTAQVTETVTATLITATPPPTRASVAPTVEQAPTLPAAEPTTASAPTTFPAPQGISPEGVAFRDGDTLRFSFASVGPLATNQCYRIEMTLGNPNGPGGVGDYWVGLCGDQSAAGSVLRFDVKPARFRDEPNYGTLLVSADEVIPPTPDYVMNWSVSVVNLLDASDPVHPQVEPISAPSASLQNTFFR
jgi:hypothetical protein